jgi:hypothetical protein
MSSLPDSVTSASHSALPLTPGNPSGVIQGSNGQHSVSVPASSSNGYFECAMAIPRMVGKFLMHRYTDTRMFMRSVHSFVSHKTGSVEIDRRIQVINNFKLVLTANLLGQTSAEQHFNSLEAPIQKLFYYTPSYLPLSTAPNENKFNKAKGEIIRECDAVISFQQTLRKVNNFFNIFANGPSTAPSNPAAPSPTTPPVAPNPPASNNNAPSSSTTTPPAAPNPPATNNNAPSSSTITPPAAPMPLGTTLLESATRAVVQGVVNSILPPASAPTGTPSNPSASPLATMVLGALAQGMVNSTTPPASAPTPGTTSSPPATIPAEALTSLAQAALPLIQGAMNSRMPAPRPGASPNNASSRLPTGSTTQRSNSNTMPSAIPPTISTHGAASNRTASSRGRAPTSSMPGAAPNRTATAPASVRFTEVVVTPPTSRSPISLDTMQSIFATLDVSTPTPSVATAAPFTQALPPLIPAPTPTPSVASSAPLTPSSVSQGIATTNSTSNALELKIADIGQELREAFTRDRHTSFGGNLGWQPIIELLHAQLPDKVLENAAQIIALKSQYAQKGDQSGGNIYIDHHSSAYAIMEIPVYDAAHRTSGRHAVDLGTFVEAVLVALEEPSDVTSSTCISCRQPIGEERPLENAKMVVDIRLQEEILAFLQRECPVPTSVNSINS